MSRATLGALGLTTGALAMACGWGSGSSWVQQPLVPDEQRAATSDVVPPRQEARSQGMRAATRTLGGATHSAQREGEGEGIAASVGGRIVGTFRNTYYDFPQEGDASGDLVALMSGTCKTIAKVPRSFFEAVCVQGSGSLRRGGTVSFAKRECACAEICPRTGQQICFDALDPATFPWGRGAAGRPIMPLRTLAADTTVLPMGTVVYIPELAGATRDNAEPSDGCFVVEDRGLRVKGQHVDIFAGHPSATATLNARVPSNTGVTVVVDEPKCAHLAPR